MSGSTAWSVSRRRLFTGAGTVGAAAALAACSTSKTSSPTGAGTTGSGGSVASVTLDSDNPTWAKGFTEAAVTLKGITGTAVTPISLPTTENYEQVVKTALQTPKTADIVKWWSGYRLVDLARTSLLTDLTDTWAALQSKGWVDPTLKASMSAQGKVYGIPVAQSYWVFFYSKPLFTKYGLKPPADWATFMSNAATLKTHGVTPMVATQNGTWPAFIWFQELLSRLDPAFYTKLVNNQATYTDPTAVKAMQLWKSFYDMGWFTKPDFDMNTGPAVMRAGKVAMMPCGTWENGAFAQIGMKSGTDYDAFILPPVSAATKPAIIVESTALTVPSKAPQHAAAVTALTNWMSPKVQKVWSGFLEDNSANPTVVSPDPVIRSIKAQVARKHLTQLGRYWEASPPNLIEDNVQTLGAFMIKPDTYPAVLKQMAATAKTQWAGWTSAS